MRILIDSREQRPLDFLSVCSDVEVERGALPVGDYALSGLTDRIACERKSIDDLVQCLSRERVRFENELKRGRGLEKFCVVVEAPWSALAAGRYRSRMDAGAACASVIAFTERYCPFYFLGDREQSARFVACFFRCYLRSRAREFEAIRASLGNEFPLVLAAAKHEKKGNGLLQA